MCQFIHQPCDRDSVAVKIMKKFGAIPFCLTNVPQTMYSMQCSNPPYGTTGSNPESIKIFSLALYTKIIRNQGFFRCIYPICHTIIPYT